MVDSAFVDALAELTTPVKGFFAESPLVDAVTPECLRDAVRAYPALGGKMLRPALLQAACGVFDESRMTQSLPIAAAVEVFHDWTLVHDDIIDNDDTRRGQPSAHRRVANGVSGHSPERAREFGVHIAILAGDIQQQWSNDLILNAPIEDAVKLAILKRLNGFIGPQLISGEAEDVAFELLTYDAILPEHMESMLLKKTGLLLRFAAEAGAMIGTGCEDVSDPRVAAVGQFAETVGLAFQLRDDLLGTFGDETALGKPVGSDLRQGKRTLLFAVALKSLESGDKKRLLTLLNSRPLSEDAVREATRLIEASGAKATLESRIATYVKDANDLLTQLPDTLHTQFLGRWAEFACYRSY